jgi:hypothetical protein
MPMKGTLALLIFYFLFNGIQLSYAACTDKDLTNPDYLRSTGRSALIDHFKKPRHQDSVGWCGAFATSDSLSFAVGEPVSALDTSINEYANTESADKNLNELYGISVVSASNVARRNGYCPESVIPSDQTSSSNLGHYALKKLMTSFQKISDDFKAKGKPSNYCVDCSTAKTEFENVIKPSLPNVSARMIQEVLVKHDGKSLESLRDLMNQLCAGNRKKPNIEVDYNTTNGLIGKQTTSIIDSALDNDSMPSIVMKASFFTNSTSEEHEMVVVGRRMEKGQCVYVVRNSWGRGCYSYNSNVVSCDPEKGTISFTADQMNSQVSHTVVYRNKDRLNTPPQIVDPPARNRVPDDLNLPPNLTRNGSNTNNKPNNGNNANNTNNGGDSNNSINSNNGNNSQGGDLTPPRNIPNQNGNQSDVNQNQNQTDQGDGGSRFDGVIEKGKDIFSQIFGFLGNFIKGIWEALSRLFSY